MTARSRFASLFIFLTAALWTNGCRQQDQATEADSGSSDQLAPYQSQLLDIAFDAASAFPVSPHIKNRSRAQSEVVEAALELNQPVRAKRYVDQIGNWMRGAGYADLAVYFARHGACDKANASLARASEVLAETEGWEKDRIRTKMAAARAFLGQTYAAGTDGIGADLMGPVARARASVCEPDAFYTQMAVLAEQTAIDDFDVIRNALGAYAVLYDRFYADEDRRDAIKTVIEAAWEPVPVLLRIEVLEELAAAALSHGDRATALAVVDQAKTLMESVGWPADIGIQVMARLAELRARAGDVAGARAGAAEAIKRFDADAKTVANIYRAGMIRPIAEVYVATGDSVLAMELYKRAVEAGMENPNSRPRTDDLVATCCSLALHEFEPDAALMARIREIAEGLGDPW